MRHLPNSNEREEIVRVINRIWDAIDSVNTNGTSQNTKKSITQTGVVGFSGGSTSSKGDKGDKGETGPTGTKGGEDLLVGNLNQWEVLIASDGGILVGPSGYALMGVNTSSVVLCGVTGDAIQPLEF